MSKLRSYSEEKNSFLFHFCSNMLVFSLIIELINLIKDLIIFYANIF